jgi:hypothetical protein
MRRRGGKKLKGNNHGDANASALSNNEGLQAWLLHEGVEQAACVAASTRLREWLNAGRCRDIKPLKTSSKETRSHG